MIESPGFFWTVMCFILVIGPLVFIHEMGHYLVGRWCGIKADVFSIGFGREVFGWSDKRGTRWKVGWMPLGGYVRFAGDMNPAGAEDPRWHELPEHEKQQVFHNKPLWKRAATVLAGPLANFLAAILILGGFAYVYGESRTPPLIATLEAGSVAEKAGLELGDRVIEINGRSVETFMDIYPIVQDRPGMRLDIRILRKGEEKTVSLIAAERREKDRFGGEFKIGRIGIGPGKAPEFVDVSLARAPIVAVERTFDILDRMITGIVQLVTGRRPISDLGGPLKIAQISGQVASLGLPDFVHLVALISINLGFINLLPVPMLDGGHLTFYAVEAIRRKPVSPRAIELAFRSGLVALMALMLFVTVNDLASFGVFSRLAGLSG
jgi:regulator of sigma E protease